MLGSSKTTTFVAGSVRQIAQLSFQVSTSINTTTKRRDQVKMITKSSVDHAFCISLRLGHGSMQSISVIKLNLGPIYQIILAYCIKK